MPTTVEPTQHTQRGHAAHPPHLAHHFDTPAQQFEASVQGMWLFLATEILLFAGLFCAYAVYRATHPEIFIEGHHHLSVKWGAINTVILLCSSFTIATAVWAVQHDRRKLLTWMLALTIAGGLGFMGIKYVEYKEKWQHGLLWGKHYQPQVHGDGHGMGSGAGHGATATGPAAASGTADTPGQTPATNPADGELPVPSAAHEETERPVPPPSASEPNDTAAAPADARQPPSSTAGSAPGSATTAAAAGAETAPAADPAALRRAFVPPSLGPSGLAREPEPLAPEQRVRNVQTFFAVYFIMTGLHGLHVIAGIAAISWLLARSLLGHFSAAYFTPVPLVGLYWHVVDLVWIYLFPLLYLIH